MKASLADLMGRALREAASREEYAPLAGAAITTSTRSWIEGRVGDEWGLVTPMDAGDPDTTDARYAFWEERLADEPERWRLVHEEVVTVTLRGPVRIVQ
jgi:hypothetical protein